MNHTHLGSSFESFLEEEGLAVEVEAGAIKKLLALQIQLQICKGPKDEDEPLRARQAPRSGQRLCHAANPGKSRGRIGQAAESRTDVRPDG